MSALFYAVLRWRLCIPPILGGELQNIGVPGLKHRFSLMRIVEGENQGSNIGNERGISVTKNLLSS